MKLECPHCEEPIQRLTGACPRCRRDLEAKGEHDPLIGRMVADKFELLDVLGHGAMGRVYRARQLSLDKIVAVKVLHRHLASDPALARRFHREARAASRLNHPNSLQIIDFGQADDGLLYIVMEYLEGRDLAEVIDREAPVSSARIAHILGQVCDALGEAHAAGIIHRDLKPENIIVMSLRGQSDCVKVCDFGIAKIQDPKADDTDAQLTVDGIVCGTPEYMSPEQASGEELDGRSDVYALGVIGYQMLTGLVPFTAKSALGVLTRHLTEPVLAPRLRRRDLPIDLGIEAVVMQALSKNREERPASPAELKRLLCEAALKIGPQALLAQDGLPTVGGTSASISTSPARPPRRLAFIVTLLVVVVVAGGWTLLQARNRTEHRKSTVSGQHRRARGVRRSQPSLAPLPVATLRPDGTAHEPGGAEPPGFEVPSTHPEPLVTSVPRGTTPQATKTPPVITKPPAANASSPLDRGRAAYEQAHQMFLAGQYTEAIDRFREAERLGFGGLQLYRGLAKAYARVGNTAAMCEAYRRVLAASPTDIVAQGIVAGQCGD